MTFEKTRSILERAISGDWHDWPLESVGGTLLLMGVPYEEAEQLVDDIATARHELFVQRMRTAGLTDHDVPFAPQEVVKWVCNGGQMPKQLEAITYAYEAAKTTLPISVNGRLERALRLAVSGAVKLQPEGALVCSQNGHGVYKVNGYNCTCPDDAPHLGQHKLCKHKLAYWLIKKANELTVLDENGKDREAL